MRSLRIRLVMITIATIIVAGPVAAALGEGCQNFEPGGHNREAHERDKTGTTTSPENSTGSQAVAIQELASEVSFEAEGKGFEPSTGFPAPDFESGR
jgi:hypothetical protein